MIDLRKVCLVIVLYMHTDSMRSALVWIFTLNVCLQILFIPGGDSKPHPRFREKITEDYNPGKPINFIPHILTNAWGMFNLFKILSTTNPHMHERRRESIY